MFDHDHHHLNPRWKKLGLLSLTCLLSLFLLFSFALAVASARDSYEYTSRSSEVLVPGIDLLPAAKASQPFIPAQQPPPTTLSVSIVSSPWAARDSNWKGGSEEVPRVLIVEAVIANTGTTPAQDLIVDLDYNEDPINNWVLLPGEDPRRSIDELAPGDAYHAYWFARYSMTINASHQYTVTAYAENASPVSTSDNYYGNPAPDGTVMTRSTLSTGSSGITQASANVVVGVAFTVTVEYDLGNDPQDVTFSPTGNVDFDPGAYRLLASEVRFFNDAGTQQSIVADRLYFDALPAFADNAEVTFTFVALALANTRLCSYTAIGYGSTNKYDQFYCSEAGGTVVPITGTLSLSLNKQANSLTVQQNQLLTYTLVYTNDGDLPLVYVWIWDEIDTSLASIIPASIDPPGDPDATTDNQVAWYLGDVPSGESGSFTFAVLVDGDGSDQPDGTPLVNSAFFGINEGSLPASAALTSTLTTTIQAPTISFIKTDGQATAEPGDTLNYTLHITNSGSVAATGLIVTDVLPADVTYVPESANPPETSINGRTLVWSLPDVAPDGGTTVINVPVTVGAQVPNGTVLTNEATVKYENLAGWIFATEAAADSTLVNAPVLAISKSDFPDPVLTSHVITYTLHYTNSGPGAATNVLITDVVPLDTTDPTCSPSPCGVSNGVISWTIDTVPASSTGSVNFYALVDATLATGDQIRNEAYGIVSDQTDVITGPPVITTVSREAAFVDGYAFEDTDGDGEFDAGEPTLQDVTITLPKATVPVTTTNSAGYYHFRVETEEPISVTAGLPADYFRTTPGTIVFLDSVFGITRTVNFGYAPTNSGFGVIYGTVFEDTDHNGVQAIGENGLSGVPVSSAQAETSSVATNDLGQYTLRYSSNNTVTIVETDLPFYVSTTPNQVVANAAVGSSGSSPIDFGDFMGIKITGQVFDDVNVNGLNDDGVYVSDATVAVSGDNFTTDSSGVYTLYTSIAGSVPLLISEIDPAGYVSTSALPGVGMSRVDANTLRIATPVSGTVYSAGDFGDVQASGVVTISGQVWNDNGAGAGGLANGLPDGTEPGLAGAIVSVSTGLSQTTTSDGLFLLYAPPDQEVTVSETNPLGYASTNAIPGDAASKLDNDTLVVASLDGGTTSADNLFGDTLASSVALLTGSVFDDANENGVYDTGESGLSGVTVSLEFSDGSTIDVTTDLAGLYEFAVAPGTEVRLTSAGPGGVFYPTTPESIIVQPPTSGVFPDNNFGYSDDTTTSVISGLVFDDVNSNGQQDFGEPGLSGAIITLNGGAPFTTGTSGLIVGTFTYSVNQAGVYALHETNPAGYRSTTPDDVNVLVALGNGYFVPFGDTQDTSVATIYGTAFDDLNGDGQQDSSEPGLAGVVISVTVSDGVITHTTESYGQYTFGVVEAGFHTVSEQDPAKPGYHSTTPDAVNVQVVLGNSYAVNFGDTTNATFSTIMGTVFNDASGDGVQDPSELGIANVPVALSNGQTTTTNANGGYAFAVTDLGFVQVIESDPPGYHSTTPNTVMVNVTALGQLYVVDFGDSNSTLLSSFFGTVFEDLNANAAWDAAEPPMSGVPVSISGPAASPPVVTNQWGQFTFLIETPGTYTVTETDPPGYVSTNAIPGRPTVAKVDNNTLRAAINRGMDLGDNLFGDVMASQVITISGYVWDDNGAGVGGVSGDGIRNGSEPGLAGATLTLSSGMAQTTGSDGLFLLYAPPGQTVTVAETNPSGYLSIIAIPGNDAEYVDDDTLRVLDTLAAGGTSADNHFGDRACTCGADSYENDDSSAQATVLSAGVANRQAHDFCDDATDWIRFTARANNVYTITTSSWGQRADTFLALFDTNASTLLVANDDYAGTTDYSSRIVWQAPADGVYYVRITNRTQLSGCDTDYDVWLEVQEVNLLYLPIVTRSFSFNAAAVDGLDALHVPTGIINHTCPDAYEVDDTWQQAHTIEAGLVQRHSFDSDPRGFAADKDFVQFELYAEQSVTFTISSIVNTQPFLELYDKNGARLAQTDQTQLKWTPAADGRYYLGVSPSTTTFGCADDVGYSLMMDVEPMYKLFLPVVGKNF